MIGRQPPRRVFFNQRETLKDLPTFNMFSDKFREIESPALFDAGIAEFWAISKTQNVRYTSLRWAARLFVVAMVPFVIAAVIAILSSRPGSP